MNLPHILFKIKFVACLFLLFTTVVCTAQFNLRISYELDYYNSDVHEALTRSYNEVENPFLVDAQELPDLNFLHGVSLGVAYQSKFLRSEIGWRMASRTRTAFGEQPATGMDPAVSFEQSMRYRIAGFYLGTELLLGRVGVGVTIANDVFRLQSNIAGSGNDKMITNQRLNSANLHLSYKLYNNDHLALVIRPYYRLFLEEADYTDVYTFLSLSEALPVKDNPASFGISFIFYNGNQN